MKEYQEIKGMITAEMILAKAKEKGLKARRGADYSIHIIRNVLYGRTKDINIEEIVKNYAQKVKEIQLD